MKSLEEENKETDWRCHFVADQEAGIKVYFKTKSPHRNSLLILQNWLFTKPKVLPITLSLIKHHSQLAAAHE